MVLHGDRQGKPLIRALLRGFALLICQFDVVSVVYLGSLDHVWDVDVAGSNPVTPTSKTSGFRVEGRCNDEQQNSL